MAEAQTQIEQEDDVAKKAALIGKELGVEDTDLDLPDYEVVEDDGDERIAKERTPAPSATKSERKQLSNKEKRDLRKKRLAEKFNAKDQEIDELRRENQEFRAWRNEVEGRLSNVDKSKVEDALVQTQAAFAQARRDHADAFNEGDGVKATLAMEAMYDAQRKLEQLENAKMQYARVQPQQPAPSTSNPNAVIINKAKAWAERQDWYDPNGGDEESVIAKALSQALATEGYDPKGDDFWDELDDRLAKRGIGNGSAEEESEDAEIEPKPAAPRKRAAPPVGGGSQRADVGGKVRVNLPTAYVQTLKDNGLWEDEAKRNRLIKNYLELQKQSQSQR